MNTFELIDIAFTALEQRKHFPGPQQPRNRFSFAPVEGPTPTADIGTVDVSALPVTRFWTVKFERGGKTRYDHVEACDLWKASIVTFKRNPGANGVQVVREISREEFEHLTG